MGEVSSSASVHILRESSARQVFATLDITVDIEEHRPHEVKGSCKAESLVVVVT